jgi:DinB superfamily
MNETLREILWRQFGASIDMLENAMLACSDELWSNGSKEFDFWYLAYHTLFYLDYYLSDDPSTFHPPKPFTLSEFDPSGLLPERVYSKTELLTYLEFGREKCRVLIEGLTDEKAKERFINEYRNYSLLEILLYNMRHVQHHAAQLNQLLRKHQNSAPKWVGRTKCSLSH